ncbi:hypothetical protein, partial [Flavobacterium sinopsychrotolerans]
IDELDETFTIHNGAV